MLLGARSSWKSRRRSEKHLASQYRWNDGINEKLGDEKNSRKRVEEYLYSTVDEQRDCETNKGIVCEIQDTRKRRRDFHIPIEVYGTVTLSHCPILPHRKVKNETPINSMLVVILNRAIGKTDQSGLSTRQTPSRAHTSHYVSKVSYMIEDT